MKFETFFQIKGNFPINFHVNKIRHKNSLKKLIHRNDIHITKLSPLSQDKVVMVTKNNDTIQHVAKVIPQVLLMIGYIKKYTYLLDFQLPMQSVPITTNVVSLYPTQLRCTHYNIM